MARIALLMIGGIFLAGCSEPIHNTRAVQSDNVTYRTSKPAGTASPIESDVNKSFLQAGREHKWPEIKVLRDTVTSALKTKWSNGKMYYSFTISPYTATMADTYTGRTGYKPRFIFSMLDSNNAERISHEVPVTAMTRVINKKNGAETLVMKGSRQCDREDYLNIVNWMCTWSGIDQTY